MIKFEEKAELQVWLDKLRDHYAEYRSIPSYSFMANLFNLKSKHAVSKFVKLMKEKNFLDTSPDDQVIPGKRFFEIPVTYSAVQAGQFTDSFAEGGEHISILDILIRKPSITRIFPIKGDSMSELGILDGDWGVYELHQFANKGELVVAAINGRNDLTLKELGKDDEGHFLIPHNKNFEIMRPKEGFHVRGILTRSFRTYGRHHFNALAA